MLVAGAVVVGVVGAAWAVMIPPSRFDRFGTAGERQTAREYSIHDVNVKLKNVAEMGGFWVL